jgi:nucleoid DNA-binding protein
MVTAPSDTSVDVRNRISITGRGTFEVTAVRERTGQLTQVFEVLHLQ